MDGNDTGHPGNDTAIDLTARTAPAPSAPRMDGDPPPSHLAAGPVAARTGMYAGKDSDMDADLHADLDAGMDNRMDDDRYADLDDDRYARAAGRATDDARTGPAEVEAALRRHEIGVVFQRCIDLRTEEAVGEEVFVRWRHPQLGELRPARFLAACTPATTAKVDRRVVHETLRAVRARIARRDPVPEVWLNLALASLGPWRNRRLLGRVARALDVDLTSLVLEIAHADLLGAHPRDLRRLHRLIDHGAVVHVDNVRLDVLDDLDTTGLGVRAVKVDAARMHLRVRGHGPGRGMSLHEWGEARGVAVIVSCLETPEQRDTAQQLGLWLAQGNLVGAPAAAV